MELNRSVIALTGAAAAIGEANARLLAGVGVRPNVRAD